MNILRTSGTISCQTAAYPSAPYRCCLIQTWRNKLCWFTTFQNKSTKRPNKSNFMWQKWFSAAVTLIRDQTLSSYWRTIGVDDWWEPSRSDKKIFSGSKVPSATSLWCLLTPFIIVWVELNHHLIISRRDGGGLSKLMLHTYIKLE